MNTEDVDWKEVLIFTGIEVAVGVMLICAESALRIYEKAYDKKHAAPNGANVTIIKKKKK